MSSDRTAASPRRVRTQPTTVGWIAIILFVFLAGIGAIVAIAVIGVYNALASDLKPPSALTTYVLPEESIIYDRTGKIELARFGDAKREVVTFDQDPQGPARCHDCSRRQDLLGQRGLRSCGHLLGRAGLAPR